MLCESCEIYGMCHEPMRGYTEEVCQHYKNESLPIPSGYVYYCGAFRKIHKKYWNQYECYVLVDCKKKWFTNENIAVLNESFKHFLKLI